MIIISYVDTMCVPRPTKGNMTYLIYL